MRIASLFLFLECKYKLKWTRQYLSGEFAFHFFLNLNLYACGHLNYITENITSTLYWCFELFLQRNVYFKCALVCVDDKDRTVLHVSEV